VFGGKKCLSVSGPINSVDRNCGKKKIDEDLRLADKIVISKSQFSRWHSFIMYCAKGSYIQNDQTASRNHGEKIGLAEG
jgi:hypothetical protein